MPEEKKEPKYKDERWDEKNKPKGYIIGASPGFAQFGQGDEKLINMGIARKIAKASRMGFEFAMIDYEALSEMFEADLKEQVAHIKTAQGDVTTGRKFEIGLHLSTDMDLCIARAYDWKIMHEKLTKGAYSGRKLVDTKFVLFHTSSQIRPHVTFKVGQQEPRVAQVSHDGLNLGAFMKDFDSGAYKDPARGRMTCSRRDPNGKLFNGLQDWFIAKFINVMFNAMGAPGDVGTINYFDTYMLLQHGSGYKEGAEALKKKEQVFEEKMMGLVDAEVRQQKAPFIRKLTSLVEQIKANEEQNIPTDALQQEANLIQSQLSSLDAHTNRQRIESNLAHEDKNLEKELKEIQGPARYIIHYDFYHIYDYWVRHGSQCEEETAYKVIAKYMWITKDPLWKDIVGMQYEPDWIIWRADIGKEYYYDEKGKRKENTKTMTLVERMITAVAAKYIQGHLFTDNPIWSMKTDDPDLKKDISVYDYLKDGNIQIFIETAMPPQGQEGQLRIMSAHDHVLLVKHLDNGAHTSYCMDFEHLTVNYIWVSDDIATLKESYAKYITMLHINAPRPIMGAHAPLEPFSRDMKVIYRWMHQLRQKGMKDAYVIWEMGSYGAKQSAIAFRELVRELEIDTSPEKLPPKFYGLDNMFEAQQTVNMREHAYDALEGMTATPEETHGMISTEAAKKGKLAEWLRGKAR
ncbi:MAG: hypothetical protein KAJ91_00225 [Candidatus Aenigmarchaeota archaeon]|nr:hypothetical protein [Candidatus Aenigmarchaeota archaeon]